MRRDDPDWWIAGLDYAGSVFFMAAVIASFTPETTGEVLNIAVVNLGTFLGAVRFVAGAYLLRPHGTTEPSPTGRRI